jgi:hypothetical protein
LSPSDYERPLPFAFSPWKVVERCKHIHPVEFVGWSKYFWWATC